MAQWLRSTYSAAHHKATLYVVPAKDYIRNVEPQDLSNVRDELLRSPNMNRTGRLPGIALLHVHMQIRVTLTICPKMAPVDSTGTIVNIELQPADGQRLDPRAAAPMVLLRHLPTVFAKLDDVEEDTCLGPGVITIQPPFSRKRKILARPC